jgi:hypothetical protein
MAKKEHSLFGFGDTLERQLRRLPEGIQLKFFWAITNYGLYQEVPVFDSPLEDALWEGMRDAIDSFGGNRRGAPRGNQNAKRHENSENQSKQFDELNSIQNNSKQFDELNSIQNNSPNINININENENENMNLESPHTLANPESYPGEPPFDEDDEGVCFDSQNLDSPNFEKPEKREEARSEAQTAKNISGYEKPESNATAGASRSNTGGFETGKPPEKTGPPNSGISGFEKPRAKINPGLPPPAAEYDKYAALHPGQSPPAADDFEAIRRKWNTPEDGIKLPECRTLSTNLNYREREILSKALREQGREAILNAISNYFWMKQYPDCVRICLSYTSLFTFLEKAVGVFCDDDVFDSEYVKPEYRENTK